MRVLARVVIAVWLSLALSACAGGRAYPKPQRHAQLAADVADAWIREHPPETLAWNWRDGVLVYGMWRFHLVSRDARYRRYVEAYMEHHLREGIDVSWSDHTTPGLTATELVLAGEARFRPLVEQVVAYVMSAPRTERQGLVRHTGARIPRWFLPHLLPDAWVDSLFHFVPTLSRYAELTREAHYEDEALAQLEGFTRNLQDPVTGLFTHAYNDAPRDEQVPSFAEDAFWARGNGWVIVTLVDILARLDPRDPRGAVLRARLARQCQGLLRVQRRDGLFHTLLRDETTYPETAGSALLAYGLGRGARVGLLDARAGQAARAAMAGLVSTLGVVDGRVVVTGTSLGTNPIARRYRKIRRRADVSYGVGAWLLAASELWEHGSDVP